MPTEARAHLDSLAERGFAVIPGGVAAGDARELLSNLLRLHAARRRAPDALQPFLNRGHDVLYNLQSEAVMFLRQFSRNALVMEILRGLLNAVVIVLAADFGWSIIKVLIERKLGGAPEPGEQLMLDPQRARIRTLLPIIQNRHRCDATDCGDGVGIRLRRTP